MSQYEVINVSDKHKSTSNMDQIFSINVDNRTATLIRIFEKAAETDIKPLVIFLQDPPILTREIIIRSYIQRYNFIPAITSSEENIKRSNIIMYDIERVECIGSSHVDNITTCSEVTIDGKLFLLCSIYLRPLAEFNSVRGALETIRTLANGCGKSRIILAGDVNGSDTLWASPRDVDRRLESRTTDDDNNTRWNPRHERTKALRGRMVSKFLKEMKLTCLNNSATGPTFVSQVINRRVLDIVDGESEIRAHSQIDIIAVGGKALRIWKKFELESITGSQHRLIKIKKIISPRPRNMRNRFVYIIKHLNESHVLALELATKNEIRYNWWEIPIETMKHRINRLTNMIIKFTIDIQNSIRKNLRVDKCRSIDKMDTGNLSIKRRNMLKRLNFLETKLKICRDNRRQDKILRLERQINKLRTRLLFQLKNDTNNRRLSEVSDTNNLWSWVQDIRDMDLEWRANLNLNNIRDTLTSQEEIEEIADIKFNKRNVIELNDELHPTDELIIHDHEFQTAIFKLRKKTFVGPEGIRFEVFLKLLEFESYREIICWWTKMCFKTAYNPKACRTTVGKLIPKRAQGQFRIVHLSSPLSAILEQVALARLEYRLEQNLQYNPRQFGFMALRGRTDLVSRIIELTIKHQIQNHFNSRTTIISLDIKGAFDNVDQVMLRNKIIEQLLPDISRFWLANFIMNRRIKITYKKLTAHERLITRGVPQGSCLGPILWNFMINRIDAHLTSMPERLEVLAFADDIYMIYNGYDRCLLQDKLNQLIRNIGNLKLEVEPSKCQVMVVDFTIGRNTVIDPGLKIYGETIKATRSLSILGIPITDTLRLNTADTRFDAPLTSKLEFLNLVKKFDVVNTHLDWATLIDSYITSVVITNNIPMLAIDAKSIEWANKLMNRSMRFIFEWPDNSSVKAIRLITRSRCAKDLTNWAISKSSVKSEFKDSYDLLVRVLRMDGLENVRRSVIRSSIPANIRALSFAETPGLKFRDPSRNWYFSRVSDLHQLYRRGPIWFALSTNSTAELILMFNDLVLEEYRGKHETYPIGHFNMMSMLHSMATRDNLPTKTIILKETNSLYAALKNSSNHDWRTNELRELLLDYSWIITTVQPQQYEDILDQLRSRGIIYKRSTEINEQTRIFRSALRPIAIKSNWPQVDDYIIMNNIKEKTRNEIRTEWMNNHTSVTAKISVNTGCWKTIPPSWISGRKLLMISGLVSDNRDTLMKGTVAPGDVPAGCQECCRYADAHTADNRWNSEVVFHRAFVCRRYNNDRYLIRKTINQAIDEAERDNKLSRMRPWNDQRSLEITLANIRYGQTLLRLLTKVAFERPTTRRRRQ